MQQSSDQPVRPLGQDPYAVLSFFLGKTRSDWRSHGWLMGAAAMTDVLFCLTFALSTHTRY